MSLLVLHRVNKTYRMGSTLVRALRAVNLSIHPGEFVAIMGPSGSGKSTLMNVLGLLDVPDSGRYRIADADVSRLSEDRLAELRGKTIGFVFQQFNLLPRLTAVENAALPLLYSPGDGADPRRVLHDMGLAERARHRPSEMSGGQQQRVAIARALVNRPRLILADEPTGNLDSATQREILALLTRLNRAGLTVIMVTHESDVARYARRVIRMHDGRIVSDERRGGTGRRARGIRRLPAAHGAAAAPEDWRTLLTRFSAHAREAGRSLAANKVRAALSMLGITIGVGAVIAMLALGTGARSSVTQAISRLGTNIISVRPNWWGAHGRGQTSVTRLTLADAAALTRAHSAVRHTAPTVNGHVQMTGNGKDWSTSVIGAPPVYADMRTYHPTIGRYYTPAEDAQRARVCLLGMTVARELFGTGVNPVGSTVRMNRIPFTVIGILPEKGASGFRDNDDIVIIPLGTAMYRVLGQRYVGAIDCEISAEADMDEVERAIRDFLVRRYRLSGAREDTFDVRNEAAFREAISSTTKTFAILLGCIAAISLLVGGIGIMNIMLVSVTERTREIGLRKAVGARPRDILAQFLVEAVVVSLAGGVLGIVLGAGAGLLMGLILKWTIIVTPWSILVSAGFSAVVGIGFGWWPARRAAALAPVDALRYE